METDSLRAGGMTNAVLALVLVGGGLELTMLDDIDGFDRVWS